MTLDLRNRHTALCLEGCNCSHCVWKVKENEILFNYRKLVPLQPGNCNCTKCLIVFSTVLYQSLHTSIEFWKQIFTYICTYMHNNRCHEYDILHIMTSFGIQPPGPSRCPSPLFLQAVLKVAGHAPVSCGFLRISRFQDFSGRKASVLQPILSSGCLSVVAFGELRSWNLAHEVN